MLIQGLILKNFNPFVANGVLFPIPDSIIVMAKIMVTIYQVIYFTSKDMVLK